LILLALNARAADVPGDAVPGAEPPQREIFVPFDDLHVILSSDVQRVFVTREEYEALAARAKLAARPQEHEQPAAVLSADYVATIEENRARLRGALVVTAPGDAWCAVPLDLSGVALRAATLDDKPAALGRDPSGATVLFVSGAGRHELQLEILAPLETAAAQRTFSFRIPTPPATRIKLTVAGNVEIKSGATIIRREVDQQPATVFDLLPRRGMNSLVLSLNNHQLRKESVVVAHGVLVDEITSAYERLHVTESLSVLHGAAEQFRFALPEGFEVTGVSGAQVGRWSITTENRQRILDVRSREPITDVASLNISAIRTPVELGAWRSPRLTVLDVAGQAAVIGLFMESRLKPYDLQPTSLVSIDASALAQSLPAALVERRPGAAAVGLVAAFYAPQGDYDLKARFAPLPAELRATTNVLLTLTESQLEARGRFALMNATDNLLGFDFFAPAGWQVTEVKLDAGVVPPMETYRAEQGGTRIHVRLPHAAPPGRSRNVYFRAVSTPDGWLDEWTAKRVEFPVFQVVGATRDSGALAVQSQDDMLARAEQVTRLTPLDANEKSKFGLANATTELAFRFEEPPYGLTLAVTRVEPRITARVFSFFRVEPELLTAHDEIAYDATEARANRLVFALPASTPAELAIHGLDDLKIKESSGVVKGKLREWTVLLGESRRGAVRLAIDFQQPLGDRERAAPASGTEKAAPSSTEVTLPLVRALGVVYQTGMVAVEGSSESDVQVKTALRKVDVGRLAEADYIPGRRLLGAFGYGGDKAEVKVAITRPAGYELPTAIVERAELLTMVSASGRSQTAARFELRCKAQLIDVQLPKGSTLWSAYLDGKPTQPQRTADSLLVELPATPDARRRDLQLVYETPVNTLGMTSRLELDAPQLLLRNKRSATSEPVPLADLVWRLSTPDGFKLVRSDGTVSSKDIAVRESPLTGVAAEVADFLSPLQSHRAYAASSEKYAAPVDSSRSWSEAAKTAVLPPAAGNPSVVGLSPGSSKSASTPATGADNTQDKLEGVQQQANSEDSAALTPQSGSGQSGSAQSGSKQAGAKEIPSATFRNPSSKPAHSSMNELAAQEAAETQRSLWALEGVRSLPIEFQPDHVQATFQSLGEAPRLSIVAIDRQRFDLLGWCVGLAVFLRGVMFSRQPLRRRIKFVALTLVVSFALPLVLPWTGVVSPICNMAFYAACWLVIYYLAAGIVRRFAGFCRRALNQTAGARTSMAALGLIVLLVRSTTAEEPATPLAVPADAIIVPYDPVRQDPSKAIEIPSSAAKPGSEKHPAKPFGADKSQKLLVPYSKYLALQRAAHPDEIVKPAPPAEYALAGGRFTSRLDGGESLLVEGHLDVDVLVDHAVAIPLSLGGGVLTKADVDGKPGAAATLKQIEAAPRPNDGKSPAAAPQSVEAASVLLISGQGRRRVDLAMRFSLERRGGWQVAEGRLPSLPAAAISLEVAKAGTEVVLARGVVHETLETKRDKETLESALAADGSFRVQWRSKAGVAPVEQSLSVRDTARFDVQEGGLRLLWRFDFEFRRSQRESFTIDIPAGYLVEKVSGSNVRGWNLKEAGKEAGGARKLDVTLLKAAQDSESFSVALSRRGAVGSGELAQFTAPVLNVEGALQQSGELTIRRSPRLELRTESADGASRADGDASPAGENADSDESPLGILPYQVYRFATTPFAIQLSARSVTPHVSAEFQTVLRISEQQRAMESRIRLRVDGRPIYRLRISVPEDLRLDRLSAPEPLQWVVEQKGQNRLVSLDFAAGQRQPFDIVLAGTLGKYGAAEAVAAPQLKIVDIDEQAGSIEQSGDVVVEVVPSLDVRAEKLVHCEPELIERVSAWLNPAQQQLVRLALRYRTSDYAAELLLSPRKPLVHCDTFTNVRVNDRTVQETILLQFTISEAGIRSLSFILPESLRGARISAPMLRQKTVETLGEGATARVRVRIELQEEAMGNLRVLVENDRLLGGEGYAVPAPVVETGQTDHRYITLESAGRDEIVVDTLEGVDPIGQAQAEWRVLTGMLGRGLTQAYLVRPGAAQPLLTLHAQDRAAVETAGARIGLAKALLVVDANGAYRGAQLYRVDNSLEQFLEIQLPAGARLWTAHVAGEPVKPAAGKATAADGDVVRIPLIKTAHGDADYPVLLKYGGHLGRLGAVDRVEFPLIHTVNIHVELSQVELDVPESYDWFNFGGTMRRVHEGELAAGWLEYNTKQIGLARQALQSDDPYARTRAAHNLKMLRAESESLKQTAQEYRGNSEVAQQLQTNSAIQSGLGVNTGGQADQSQQGEEIDNRTRLGAFYKSQSNARANDIVNSAGTNFSSNNNIKFQQGSFAPGAKPSEPTKDSGEKKGQGSGGKGADDAGKSLSRLQSEVRDERQDLGQSGPAMPGEQLGAVDASGLLPPKLSVQFDQFNDAAPSQNDDFKVHVGGRISHATAAEEPDFAETGGGAGAARSLKRYAGRVAQQAGERGPSDYAVNGGEMKRAKRLADLDAIESKNSGLQARQDAAEFLIGKLRSGNAGSDKAAPTALASLDVELHPRGVKYLFTTPRGDAAITAQAVSDSLEGRLFRLAALAVVVVVLLVLGAAVRRRRVARPAYAPKQTTR
jgi:hypothetical protein